jgi:hypothetical protein
MKKFCFLFVCLFGYLELTAITRAQGFIKPVGNMPEYNGMYKGSPFTGSAVYTTLYRDNQDNGARGGCRGEGCGRHPGVDIAVPSGTTVFAPLSGTIMISRCDNAWGGLVVIKSTHPSRSWENIFQVFGHLKAREYSNGIALSVGDFVAAGSIIGKSGGKGGSDPCSGNSTGSHLHYQIDKDDGNSEPWYPNPSLLNYRDDDFQVMNNTYNPIVLLQGGYRWKFAENNNRELWDIFNLQSWGVGNNAMWMDGNIDPYVRRGGVTNCGLSKPCSSSIASEAQDFPFVYLDAASQCASSSAKIYFTTKDENFWDENKSIPFTISNLRGFRGLIQMNRNPKWQGIVTGIRIDPAENCASSFDPIYFGEIALQR